MIRTSRSRVGRTLERRLAASRVGRERVIPFFAFPAEIRKIIYTTNAVESLNMSLRKSLKTRGAFHSKEAALKVMYLAYEM